MNAPVLINGLSLFSDNVILTHINSCLLLWMVYLFKMWSTLKGKNLLLEEQILSLRVDSIENEG